MANGMKLKPNKKPIKDAKKAAMLEFDKIMEFIRFRTLKYLRDASPILSGDMKDSWNVEVSCSGSSKITGNSKGNTLSIIITVTNDQEYTGILRGDYRQRGNILLLAYPRPDGKLEVISASRMTRQSGRGGDNSSPTYRKPDADGLLRIVTIPNKLIKAKSRLEKHIKQNIEQRVRDAVNRKLKNSKYFTGTVEIEFESGYMGR